jgi:hypothetical protein
MKVLAGTAGVFQSFYGLVSLGKVTCSKVNCRLLLNTYVGSPLYDSPFIYWKDKSTASSSMYVCVLKFFISSCPERVLMLSLETYFCSIDMLLDNSPFFLHLNIFLCLSLLVFMDLNLVSWLIRESNIIWSHLFYNSIKDVFMK